MVKETLLDGIPLSPSNIHPIRTQLPLEPAAAAYDADVCSALGVGAPAAEHVRLFDLILLGLGSDGHTASLFPHHPALLIRDRWTPAVSHREPPDPAVDRISLTVPPLCSTHAVIFMASGPEKAEVLRRTLDSDANDPALPATWIRPDRSALLWAVDRSAAERLS